MKKRILTPFLLVIISILMVFQVNGATESDLSASCNLVDYTEDCAKLGTGLFIRCSTDAQIDLATCLSIWHGGAEVIVDGNGVITIDESVLSSSCNLIDYITDCAKLGPGLYINCETDAQITDVDECLRLWHGGMGVTVVCDGDGNCLGSETCLNCQVDCGSCPGAEGPPGSSPGSSGRSRGYGGFCISNWDCSEWSPCIFGKKTRTCRDLNQCEPPTIYGKPAEEMRCEPQTTATCYDGILNQGETGVDCGGPCPVCATCFDEIENCHDGVCESGVDCGGSCMPCSWWKVSGKVSFWIIFITSLLVLIVLILGLWYWKLNKGAEDIGEFAKQFTRRPSPPTGNAGQLKRPLPPAFSKKPSLEHF